MRSDQLYPGLPIGDTRILGVELDFSGKDQRGRVWVPLNPGCHLLYGKNGVGKSTILRAIRAALTGDLSEEQLGFGVKLFVSIDDHRPPIHVNRDLPGSPDVLSDEPDSLDESFLHEISFDDDSDGEDYETELEDADDLEIESARPEYSLLTDDVFKGDWWRGEYAALERSQDLLQRQLLFVPETLRFEPECLEYQPIASVPLQQIRAAWLTYFMLERETLWDGGGERPHLDHVLRFNSEALEQPYYCLSPRGKGEWQFSIAVKIESENTTKFCKLLKDDIDSKCRQFHSELGWSQDQIESGEVDAAFIDRSFTTEFLNNVGPLPALVGYDVPAYYFSKYSAVDCPFVSLGDWREPVITTANAVFPSSSFDRRPVSIVCLEPAFDLQSWNRQQVATKFAESSTEEWKLEISRSIYDSASKDLTQWGSASSNTIRVSSRAYETHEYFLDEIVEGISELGIGIDGLRTYLSNKSADWIFGAGCRLEARDVHTKDWFSVSGLSPAQSAVLAIAVQLGEARAKSDVVIAIGDEIDNGMHILATKALYRYISNISDSSYLATHSPVILSMQSLQRVHVRRGEFGGIATNRWTPSRDFNTAAQVLGVERTHLLSAVSCWLVVEGEHDKTAFEVLLQSGFISDVGHGLTHIVASRGHLNAPAVLDSDLLLEFSDAPIIVILDAAATDLDFSGLHTKARDLEAEGLQPSKIVQTMGLEDSRPRLRPESRTLLSILNGAIRRRLVHRIHPVGLKKPDIIQYVPAASFGLSADWSTLFNEYRAANLQISFKDWLRDVKQARISARAIREAFEEVSSLDDDLAAVLMLIERVSQAQFH